MSQPKIAISQLQKIDLDEALNTLWNEPETAKVLFHNTDLEGLETLDQFAKFPVNKDFMNRILQSDINEDGYLDQEETVQLLAKNLSASERAKSKESLKTDAIAFHRSFHRLMKTRYIPFSENFRHAKLWIKCFPLIEALKVYNHGLKVDGVQFARTTLTLRGIEKAFKNAVWFIPNAVRLAWNSFTGEHNTKKMSWYPMDDEVQIKAQQSFKEGERAIGAFSQFISRGIENKTPWSAQGEFSTALEEFSKVHPELSELLKNRLHIFRLYHMIHTAQEKERWKQAIQWVRDERPTNLGFSGGLSKPSSGLRFGLQHNIYFARSLIEYLQGSSVGWQWDVASDIGYDIVTWREQRVNLFNPFTWVNQFYQGDLDYLGVSWEKAVVRNGINYTDDSYWHKFERLNLNPINTHSLSGL